MDCLSIPTLFYTLTRRIRDIPITPDRNRLYPISAIVIAITMVFAVLFHHSLSPCTSAPILQTTFFLGVSPFPR